MKKAFVIFLFITLVIGGKKIVDTALAAAMEDTDLSKGKKAQKNQSNNATNLNSEDYEAMNLESYHGKELAAYYKNRAYDGAPPIIPHPVEDESIIGGKYCLQCHQHGGFVNKFNAFAPVTPHPEKINCVQCHASVKTDGLFKETNWSNMKQAHAILGNSAMEGSPPVIPHKLTNFRDENCLSCHAGPSAPKEIRVSHPERVNCLQCHAQKNSQEVFFKTIK